MTTQKQKTLTTGSPARVGTKPSKFNSLSRTTRGIQDALATKVKAHSAPVQLKDALQMEIIPTKTPTNWLTLCFATRTTRVATTNWSLRQAQTAILTAKKSREFLLKA
jgi:hypothetical protein